MFIKWLVQYVIVHCDLITVHLIGRCDPTREIQSLKICQGHPNIVTLYDVYHDDVSIERLNNYDEQDQLYTVT
jgi:hypothetical protein